MAPDTTDLGPEVAYTAVPSFGQQRLWVLDRLWPGKPVYNETRAERIEGSLDAATLQRALDEIVRRHDILRTRFAVVEGEPRQVVAAAAPIPITREDLSAVPAAERTASARAAATAAGAVAFDLERGPLLRVHLLRLAPDEHWLAITLHHIISDRWTSGILTRELSALYAAFAAGEPSPLPELPVQYADYAAWQREWMQGETLEREIAHWRGALAGLPVLELPLDRPRPAIPEHRGGRFAFEIDAATVRSLKELGRSEGATLFMTLLAGFFVLLSRYSAQEDLAVGIPIAGRNKPELEDLLGFFVNTLVLRGDVSGDPPFRLLLARVRKVALEAYSHQDLPFEKLVEAIAPARDLSRNPLFQVSFALQNSPMHGWNVPGLAVAPVLGLVSESAKFDVGFAFLESGGALRGRVDYMTELFDAATIERMAGHFRALLASIVADPLVPVSRLALYEAAERRRLVVDWNATAVAYPSRESVARLFEAQVARSPQAAAVSAGGRALTYADLDARANRLAHALATRAATPGKRIGVCLERGEDLVVAMLGVLKAGAAYVPLDPVLPVERLALLIADAEVALVVTDAGHLPRLPVAAERVICVDRDHALLEAQAVVSPPSAATADDAAYVMYTSGSTGTPKGVLVRHRSIAHLVCGTDYVRLEPDDVVAQIANPAFDAATFEVWGALLNGARLAVVPRDVALSPSALAAAIADEGITTLFLTTALFNQIARDAPAAFRTCRNVLFGGEMAEARWAAAVLAQGAPQRLLHVYGPTETTTFATCHEVRAIPEGARTIPIGRPIANVQAYILDRHGEPMPIDIPGELYIGGPGVAAGYLNRPELTAERFVAHRFSDDPGARLYRTGDIARCRGDGTIEFIGRADRQVKVRGHRIEPGEIEAALGRLPRVKEAVVVLHGETSDERRLNAYVVTAEGMAPDADALWRELRRTLPEYMIPAGFVFLHALPHTPSGKIDRTKLPDPKDLAERRVGWYLPPTDPSQRMVAAVWEELLGVKQIGAYDNFFERGGHSLLAARMVDRIEVLFGVKVPLAVLFTHATLEQFTRAMRDEAMRVQKAVLPIQERGSLPPIFFLHGDFTGGGFFSKALAEAVGPDRPFYAVHPHGLIDDRIPDTIEAMAAERLAAIREARPRGPYVLGGHCAGALVALEIARTLVKEGERVPLVFIVDANAPWQVTRVFEGISIGNLAPRSTRRRRLAEPAAPPEPATPSPPAAMPAAEGPDQLPAGDAFAKYRQAMRRYVCAPYPGALAVLRPESNRDMRPTLGWSAVSPQCSMHVMPGDHHTAITRHVKETAAILRQCLDAESPAG
jgi:amino acid adenylation domain-containing protein